ncbi:MAG TPA: hypothetical protein VF096_05050 [Azonexus sp.]
MAYEIVWEPEGILVQFSGHLAGRELVHAARETQGDSRFDEAHYVINDFTSLIGHGLGEDALVELSALHYGAYASHPNCRIVFVTTDAELATLVKRVLTAPEMASYQIAIMESVTSARDWLDSQPDLHVMSNVMGFRLR